MYCETPEEIDKAFWLLPPRPVVLVSTIDKKGNQNVAPHCEFIKLYEGPFLIAIEKSHDTFKNILETKEFVVSIPTIDIAKKIAITGKPFPKGVSEFEKAGLTPLKASKVKAPLVKECCANFECKLIKELGSVGTESILVGEILCTHYKKVGPSEEETRLSTKAALHVHKGRIYTTINKETIDTKIDYTKL
ncbi:MAG: flavin reductase family protein [Candidatus Diapherotrites archaeon]|nr:flavin reductase family protein [Candidatus Diapherotrites archaeon]